MVFSAYSLDAPLSDRDDPGQLADMLGDEDADVERAIDMEAVATHWDELPEREQQILTMRFYGNLTQAEIGATPRHLPDARVPAALPRAGPPPQPPARRGRLTPHVTTSAIRKGQPP